MVRKGSLRVIAPSQEQEKIPLVLKKDMGGVSARQVKHGITPFKNIPVMLFLGYVRLNIPK